MNVLGSCADSSPTSKGNDDKKDSHDSAAENLYLSLAKPQILTRILRCCCRILANIAASTPDNVQQVRMDLDRAAIYKEEITDEMSREYLSLLQL